VLTVSIHGHPRFAYPYFTGFVDERGRGAGVGYNLNLPLPESVTGDRYRQALARALRRLKRFDPEFLVVAFGLDPANDDPTGSWSLKAEDFEANGRMIGSLRVPTLVVQEGGYRIRSLGANARHFFLGLWHGFHGRKPGNEGTR
jgi:acetoin utilization deacetylase AcuC-like enzyme